MSGQWKAVPPPNGGLGGNPWTVQNSQGETVAIIATTMKGAGAGRKMAEQIVAYRKWTQKLLDVSEYVGTDREDASRWQCAFGCGGYSYDSLEGVTTADGGYKRTPPVSRDWHAPTCLIRALVVDLGIGEQP